MKNIIFLNIIFALQLRAQNYPLPVKLQVGKCYERCFYYENIIEWKEVDCKKVKTEINEEKIQERLIKRKQKIMRMKKY